MEGASEASKRKAGMEVEAPSRSPKGKSCRIICLALAAVIILIILVIVILGLTVFKPRHPVTNIDSVQLNHLSASVDVARLRVLLNVTLDVAVSVTNPNRVGFEYTNTSALVNYRGELVGEGAIPAGHISPQQTLPFNLTLTLMADRLLSHSQLFSDVMSDALPLNTFVKVSGRVFIFSIFKVHVDSSTSCDFSVVMSNRTITNQHCTYKTQL